MKKTNHTKARARKGIIIAVSAIIVLSAAGVATYLFANREKSYPVTDPSGQVQKLTLAKMNEELDVETIYQGITINGVDVSGKTKAEAAAMFAGEPSLDTPVIDMKLSVDGNEYTVDPSVVKIASNLPLVIDTAYNYNRTSDKTVESEAIVERYQRLLALKNQTVNFETEYTADTAAIGAAVHAILDPLESAAVDAAATAFDVENLVFVISESSQGFDVDIDGAVIALKAAIDAKEYTKTITVTTSVIEPAVSKEMLASTLGFVSTKTTKTTDVTNRNINIDLVCKAIDGLVLQPGEFFNFNEFVGKRTAEKGFKEAGGIFDGALRLELGGGICQASGTLFHSVMMADLQVDERHPHSWPSTYVDIGTDATVTWDGPNFQFTNNTEFPLAIHAYYRDRTVTVSIYGRPVDDGMTIKIEGVVTGTSAPGPTEFVADPLMPVGSRVQVRSPHDYISAQCFKIYYKDGVEVKRELAFTSTYRAITEKISVGVLNTDGTILPMDPLTGTVIMPTPVPTVVPEPTAEPTPAEPTPAT